MIAEESKIEREETKCFCCFWQTKSISSPLNQKQIRMQMQVNGKASLTVEYELFQFLLHRAMANSCQYCVEEFMEGQGVVNLYDRFEPLGADHFRYADEDRASYRSLGKARAPLRIRQLDTQSSTLSSMSWRHLK